MDASACRWVSVYADTLGWRYFVYRYKEEPGAVTRGMKFTLGATLKILLENLATEGDAVFTKLAP